MKLAPDRKKFMEVLGGSGDIYADIEKFCMSFSPLLEENHKFLVRCLVKLQNCCFNLASGSNLDCRSLAICCLQNLWFVTDYKNFEKKVEEKRILSDEACHNIRSNF